MNNNAPKPKRLGGKKSAQKLAELEAKKLMEIYSAKTLVYDRELLLKLIEKAVKIHATEGRPEPVQRTAKTTPAKKQQQPMVKMLQAQQQK